MKPSPMRVGCYIHKYNTGKHLSPSSGTSRPKRGVVLVQSQPATKKPTAPVAPPTSSSKDTHTYYPSLSPHTQSTTALPSLTPPASSIPLLTVPLNPAIPVVPPANSQFLSPVKSSTLSNPRAGVSSDQTVVADGRSPRKKRFVLLAYTSCALS